jgi:Co/Zn/Cd efflux system component
MDECCRVNTITDRQRHVFQVVLWINAAMFLVESLAGIAASSSALLADSVDMLGDAIVYGVSLYAVGRGMIWQTRAAFMKGVLMALFGLGVVIQVVFKLLYGVVPSSETMGIIGVVALVANLLCLYLLWQHRHEDINMRSAWLCSRNDVIGNVGVLVAALGVAVSGSAWPDILIGVMVAAVFCRSAVQVLRQASQRHSELVTG